MSRAGRGVDLAKGIDKLLREPMKIDLARAVIELEEAAQRYASRSALEGAAAVVAASIAYRCESDMCATLRRAGISQESYAALRDDAFRTGIRTSGTLESRALGECEIVYSVNDVTDGAGRVHKTLLREAEGFPDEESTFHSWLLEPFGTTYDERAFTPHRDVLHAPTLEVLLAFADEARRLVAELAHEMRLRAEDIVNEAQDLEQLAETVA